MSIPTGLEKITEGNNIGWRLIGRDSVLYGDIGQGSIDFSTSNVNENIEPKGAIGSYSLAFGMNTVSSGSYSLAGGNNTKSQGLGSVALGQDSVASGDYSFTVGQANNSSSIGSFTVGYQNRAEGDFSFAGGTNSKVLNYGGFATGFSSFAFGDNVKVTNPSSAGFGRFNLTGDASDNSELYKIFTIGIGTSESDRRNAFEVYDGSGIEYGSVKAPYLQQATIDADLTGKVLITKEYLESKYNRAFDDAPIDGFVYGRKNKGWTRVAELAAVQVFFKGTLPPPSDFKIPGFEDRLFEPGDVYLQYNIPVFTTDGNVNYVDGSSGFYDGNTTIGGGEKLWVVKDGSLLNPPTSNYWEELKISGGIEDAPIDNVKYVRRNGSWEPIGIQQVVYKGKENPNNLPSDLGTEGDKYLQTPYQTTGSDYTIDLAVIPAQVGGSLDSYRYDNSNGTIISGTPDISYIDINNDGRNSYLRIVFIDTNSVNPNGFITINNIIFNISDASFDLNSNSYNWNNLTSDTATLYQGVSNDTNHRIVVHSEVSVFTQKYQEYIKQSDGTWKSINIEVLQDTPIDKLLENADIVSTDYSVTPNIITYGGFSYIPAGYKAEISSSTNSSGGVDTTTVYKDPTGAVVLTTVKSTDSSNRVISFTRTYP